MDIKTITANLQKIKALADEVLAGISSRTKLENPSEEKVEPMPADYILAIVNKIKNCDECDKIEKKILDKSAISGRVMLPFYICYKYFHEQGLTTGEIEKITSELRVKVKTSNVSTAISGVLRRYVDGNSMRTRGKTVVYKLNRRGATEFEKILNEN